jgi:hypothetical protein
MLEDRYVDWIKYCRAKCLDLKVGIIATNTSDKSGHISTKNIYIKHIEIKDAPLDKSELKLSRDAKEMMKFQFVRRMMTLQFSDL